MELFFSVGEAYSEHIQTSKTDLFAKFAKAAS